MFVNCLSCQNYDHCDQLERWDGGCINHKLRPQTNADRIRSMTDEEMAEWMAKYCERKTVFCPNFGAHDCQESCEQCWLDWLRTEVTE